MLNFGLLDSSGWQRQEHSMGRRGYPLEFRRKALNLLEAERAIAEVAKALGSAPSRSHLAPPGPHRLGRTVRPEQPRAQPANLGEPWPDLQQPERRVSDAGDAVPVGEGRSRRRFHDLHNLVYDPAFLVVAFSRVLGDRAEAPPGRRGWFPPTATAQGAEPRTSLLNSASLTPTRNYQALIVVGPWTTQAPRMPQPPTLTAICSMSRFFREATAPI